jgi:hypothetical protein
VKEIYQFRIPDDLASRYLPREVGETIGNILHVRKVITTPDSEEFACIRDADRELRSKGSFFFTSISVRRKYTRPELDGAELLTVEINAMFEPAGEECGTVYDDAASCSRCGAPRRQVSDLFLDLTSIPRSKNAAFSIARNEIVFAAGLAKRIHEERLTGVEFRPVHHWRQAKRVLPEFVQPWIVSSPISSASKTKFGNSIFDDDPDNLFRCPSGPVVGASRISELFVSRESWDRSDFVQTRQYVGIRRGLLNPHPILVVSQRTRRIIEAYGGRG